MGIEYIVGVLLTLLGYAAWLGVKKRSAEALLGNLETKNKLNELEKDISKNDGLEEAEEEYRKVLKRALEKSKKEDETLEDLEKYFNKPGNS